MKLFTLFSLLLTTTISLAQSINGIITSTIDSKVIPYVNIGLLQEGIGTVSNINGAFYLEIPSGYDDVEIGFSSIGYQSITLKLSDFIRKYGQNDISLKMKPTTYSIDEVTITKDKLNSKIKGNKTTSQNISSGYAENKLGCEIATYINLRRKEQVRLNRFKFSIAHNACDSLFFRVNIYNKKRGGIGDNITPQNIIVQTAVKSGVVTVDLDPYDIWLDEDFYVGLEWIRDFCSPEVQDELNFSSNLWKTFYYKSTSLDNWKKLRGIGIGMWLEVSSNK